MSDETVTINEANAPGVAPPEHHRTVKLQREGAHIRLDLHVHVNPVAMREFAYGPCVDPGATLTALKTQGGQGAAKRVPTFMVAACVALSLVVTYKIGNGSLFHNGLFGSTVAAGASPAAARTASAADLPKELQEPPVVSTPPGATPPGAPSGPSVFGLGSE
jgi:hypothetical protein